MNRAITQRQKEILFTAADLFGILVADVAKPQILENTTDEFRDKVESDRAVSRNITEGHINDL